MCSCHVSHHVMNKSFFSAHKNWWWWADWRFPKTADCHYKSLNCQSLRKSFGVLDNLVKEKTSPKSLKLVALKWQFKAQHYSLISPICSLNMNVLASAANAHIWRLLPPPNGGGAGVFTSPTVPLRASSSDGHQMGLDKELIWASITASGKGQIDSEGGGEDPTTTTTTLVSNQVNVSNSISHTLMVTLNYPQPLRLNLPHLTNSPLLKP